MAIDSLDDNETRSSCPSVPLFCIGALATPSYSSRLCLLIASERSTSVSVWNLGERSCSWRQYSTFVFLVTRWDSCWIFYIIDQRLLSQGLLTIPPLPSFFAPKSISFSPGHGSPSGSCNGLCSRVWYQWELRGGEIGERDVHLERYLSRTRHARSLW